MTAEFTRDATATAAIFGFFAASWFGWAQEKPPRSWRKVLLAGSIASLLIAVSGGLLVWRAWSDGTVFDADTSRLFGVIVAIELAVAGLGSGVLTALRKRDLIPAWIALVVGVHLFPLAPLLQYPLIYVTAVIVTSVALASVPLARSKNIAASAVTGLATGTILLASALFALATVVT